MVLAAMSMTSALSFSQGEMKNSYQFYRELLGGEILVAPVRWAGQQVSDVTGSGRLEYRLLQTTGLSRLEVYYPELYRDGFFSSPDQVDVATFRLSDLQALTTHIGVSGYTILPQFEADLVNETRLSDKLVKFTVLPLPSDGRLPGLETDFGSLAQSEYPVALINSHLIAPDDLVAMVALTIPTAEVVSDSEEIRPTEDEISARKLRAARSKVLEDLKLPRQEEWVSLTVPSYRTSDSQGFVPNCAASSSFRLQVVQQVSVPTRSLSWINSMGATVTETAFLHGAYLWVSSATWLDMWQQVSGTDELPLQNITLQVGDMNQLDLIVRDLQSRFPQFTFVSVAEFARRMEATSLIDRFYRAPSYLYRPAAQTSLAVPMQLGTVMGVLFFLIAGMLIMSRMLTGAAARRLEVGILKALGARRRDIGTMVLTEALLITFIGTTIGFLLVRMGGVIMEIGNQVPFGQVLWRTLTEYGIVTGLATLVSLAFSLLPAIRMSNLTVMGVLRGE